MDINNLLCPWASEWTMQRVRRQRWRLNVRAGHERYTTEQREFLHYMHEEVGVGWIVTQYAYNTLWPNENRTVPGVQTIVYRYGAEKASGRPWRPSQQWPWLKPDKITMAEHIQGWQYHYGIWYRLYGPGRQRGETNTRIGSDDYLNMQFHCEGVAETH